MCPYKKDDVLNEAVLNNDVRNTDVLNEAVLSNDVLTTDVLNEVVLNSVPWTLFGLHK